MRYVLLIALTLALAANWLLGVNCIDGDTAANLC